MIQPTSLDVILREFSEDYRVWAIQGKSEKYLVIPDLRFFGRRPILFFKNRYDASRVLDAVLRARPAFEGQRLVAVEVRLLKTLREVKADKSPAYADSFVVYPPNEVSEFISQFKAKTVSTVGRSHHNG